MKAEFGETPDGRFVVRRVTVPGPFVGESIDILTFNEVVDWHRAMLQYINKHSKPELPDE